MRTILYFTLTIFFYVICCITPSLGQLKPSSLKPKEIKKLSKVEVVMNGKKLPESRLYGIRESNLVVLMDIAPEKASAIYVEKEIPLDSYDYLIVSSKKNKVKQSLIWGLAIGGLSYFVGKKAGQSDAEVLHPLQQKLKQKPNSGHIEGIGLGIIGGGLGILLGRQFSKKKIDLKVQQMKTLKKLDAFHF